MKKILLTLTTFLIIVNAYGWGTDVLVGPQATGKATLVSTSTGVLYCSIPAGYTGVGGMRIFSSTDNGQTWNMAGTVVGLTVSKSKMLVTGTDSVYCVYQVNNDLYVYSIAASVSTQFTTMQVDDWDAAASPNSNSIYLFCDDFGNSNLNRYSSVDGGYSWTGSTALVAGDAAHPRVHMAGTRLILTYYGPILSDTAASVIREAYYDETSPGQLTHGPFQDIITNGMHHRLFMPVKSGSYVWFFYTEGDSSQSIYYLVSSDDGATFGSPMTLISAPAGNADCFDVCSRSDAGGDGVRVAYFFEASGVRTIYYSDTYNTSPSFTVFDAINDLIPECFPDGGQVSVVSFNTDAGVIFQEDSSHLSTYFDRFSATVGIDNTQQKNFGLYPNPASSEIVIETPANEMISICDLSGRAIKSVSLIQGKNIVDISKLAYGVYIISQDNRRIKFVKQ